MCISEACFVRYCSPTLAGLKTANLFSCSVESSEALRKTIGELNQALSPKGIRVVSLRYRRGCALIYSYRPDCLERDLKNECACRLLQKCGYSSTNPECCLSRLIDRLASQEDFPHEIGLFLGYPPEDVAGFIEHGARDYKCSGKWKVYGDEERARKIFEKYNICTKILCAQHAQGKPLDRLTVAVGATERSRA